MTIPQAQRFVGHWQRILILWPTQDTNADAARTLERSFLGIAIGPLVPFFLAVISGSLPLSRWPLTIIIPAGTVMLLSYWLSLRFRIARHLFEEADALHLSDLRRHV
jgi:hypothetical protein